MDDEARDEGEALLIPGRDERPEVVARERGRQMLKPCAENRRGGAVGGRVGIPRPQDVHGLLVWRHTRMRTRQQQRHERFRMERQRVRLDAREVVRRELSFGPT